MRLPKLPSPPPSGTVVSDGRQLSEPRSPGTGEWDEVGGKKSTGPRGLLSSPPPHAQLTLQPLRAGLRESRNGCVRILRCNRCGPVSGGPATAARGVGESGGP